MIKRIIHRVLLVLVVGSLACAQDVPNGQRGPSYQLARNVIWSGTGTGGFNANYLLFTPTGDQNLCVQVTNLNPSSAHTFYFAAYGTNDLHTSSFLGGSNPAALEWNQLPMVGPTFNGGAGTTQTAFQIQPYLSTSYGNIDMFWVGARGYAKVALSFYGGTTQAGSPDTANVNAQATQAASCMGGATAGTWSTAFYQAVNSSGSAYWITLGTGTGSGYVGGSGIDPSTFASCTFNASLVNTAGTTPTLNLYIQDEDVFAPGGSFLNDRVSFVQATTGTSQQQVSVLAGLGTQNPAVVKNGTLGAGTVVAGRFSQALALKWVLGGSSPAYNIWVSAHCQ